MENDVQELVQFQNTSMNSILKQKKCTKDQISNSENYMTPKQETIFFNKSTTRSDDNYGKTRLRQNLYGFKKENTQTYDRQHKENSNKTQISLKQKRKLQEIKELLK